MQERSKNCTMSVFHNQEVKEYLKEIKAQFPISEIHSLFHSLRSLKVLVIGDTIIDEYCFVEPKGRAMKDPMLSTEFIAEEAYAGGILAIANHVSNFVGEVAVVTLLGEGMESREFVVKKLNSNITPYFFEKKNSPTTKKKRFISQNRKEKLFKVEYLNDQPISEELEQELMTFLASELPRYGLVLVGDFGHGFLSQNLIKLIEEKAPQLALNVQTNSANLGFNFPTKYQRTDFLTLDGMELRYTVRDQFGDYPALLHKFRQLGFQHFLVTLGKGGAAYCYKNEMVRSPAFTTQVTDVVGAGDAVFSITSLLCCQGVQQRLIPFIANCAGAIKVNIMGNKESITQERLLEFIGQLYREVEEDEIHTYFGMIRETLDALDKGKVSSFVKMLLDAYYNDKAIYVFGNGGSAATASHFCGDLIKGVSYGLQKRFKAICLNDNTPAIMAIANDVSYDDIFLEQLKNFLRPGDVVVGISGSGNSTNVIKALEYANQQGATTIAICGFSGGKIKEISNLVIHAEINDMEVSEDIHNLIIIHCVKRLLSNELNNHALGEQYAKRVSGTGFS